MPTTNVGPGSALELQCIADIMGKSKKVVVITGAGISTNCGIPDFRSENGLYSLIQAQYDAALKDPSAYTEEIDDRPTKRRRVTDRWTYVTVKADTGEVVTDPDLVLPFPRASSRSQDSNENSSEDSTPAPTTSSARKPVNNSSSASLRPRRSLRSQLSYETSQHEANPTNTSSLESSAPNSNPQLPPHRRSTPAVCEPPANSSSAYTSNEANLPNTSFVESIDPNSNPQLSPQRRSTTTKCKTLAKSPSAYRSNAFAPSRSPSVQDLNPQETSPRRPSNISSQKSPELACQPGSDNTSEASRTRQDHNRGSLPVADRSALFPSIENHVSSTDPPARGIPTHPLLQPEDSSIVTTRDSEQPSSQPSQSSQSSRTSLPNLKGRDLFDSMVWSDPFTTSVFYRFISTLRQKVKQDVTTTTESHGFIRTLRDSGRLVRNYTQNIDGLEARQGLSTELEMGPGSRSRFSTRVNKEIGGLSGGVDRPAGVDVVQLHGNLESLRCGICTKTTSWDHGDRESVTMAGQAPDCPYCEANNAHRTGRGRRGLAVGRLRPDIVLYGEEHPNSHLIAPLVTHDLGLGPDFLLILGTSLRVHGLKVMVKEFAKAVHSKGGKVVFVNQTKPSESVWGDVIDYWVEWDCDAWVLDLKRRRGDIWHPPGAIEKKRQSSGDQVTETKRPSRPSATRDCKLNGAHFTFRILETLGNILDPSGQPAVRKLVLSSTTITKAKPHKKVITTSTVSKESRITKRQSRPAAIRDDKQNAAYLIPDIINKLRRNSESLIPLLSRESLAREALASLSTNVSRPLATSYKDFNFSLQSNILPGLRWPLESMNLLTHPPNTTGTRMSTSTNVENSKKEFYNALSPIEKRTVSGHDDRSLSHDKNTHSHSTRFSRSSQNQEDDDKQRLASLKSLGIKTMTLPQLQQDQPQIPTMKITRSNRSSRRSSQILDIKLPRERVRRACDECRVRKRACKHKTYDSEAPVLPIAYVSAHVTMAVEEFTQETVLPPKPATRARTSDAIQLQDAVDAQLLLEVMAPKSLKAHSRTSSTAPKAPVVRSRTSFIATKAARGTACDECRNRKRRCDHNRHSLPTPPSSDSFLSDSSIIDVTQDSLLQDLTLDNSSDPLTPSTQRIKNMGKIGAVLSSPVRSLRSKRSELFAGIE